MENQYLSFIEVYITRNIVPAGLSYKKTVNTTHINVTDSKLLAALKNGVTGGNSDSETCGCIRTLVNSLH